MLALWGATLQLLVTPGSWFCLGACALSSALSLLSVFSRSNDEDMFPFVYSISVYVLIQSLTWPSSDGTGRKQLSSHFQRNGPTSIRSHGGEVSTWTWVFNAWSKFFLGTVFLPASDRGAWDRTGVESAEVTQMRGLMETRGNCWLRRQLGWPLLAGLIVVLIFLSFSTSH